MSRLTIRCSSLDRILKCPGSLKLEAIDEQDSTYAAEGKDAHDEALLDYFNLDFSSPYLQYLDNPRSYYNGIEYACSAHFDNFTLTGTVDFWRIINGSTLEVVDLKTGYVDVSPLTNQLKGYALLLCNHLVAFDITIAQIKLTVFQNDKPQSVTLSVKEIASFVNYLEETIKKDTISEGKHCQYCPSFLFCPLKKLTVERSHDQMTQPTPMDFKRSRELLLARSEIVKYLDKLKINFIQSYPDSVGYKTRKSKVWREGVATPLLEMSVAKAIKNGYYVDGLFNIKETKVVKII